MAVHFLLFLYTQSMDAFILVGVIVVEQTLSTAEAGIYPFFPPLFFYLACGRVEPNDTRLIPSIGISGCIASFRWELWFGSASGVWLGGY